MSPASGDTFITRKVTVTMKQYVSIQLMSPASGDGDSTIPVIQVTGFHSINVPSEWGHWTRDRTAAEQETIVSIQLMSPASGDNLRRLSRGSRNVPGRFHSINVPSEWGQSIRCASAQLVLYCFHSINVPSEWGLYIGQIPI